MATFFDSKGNSYELTHQIGRGGEGTVFACPDGETIVAKIYHEPIDDEKAEKLRWMADNSDEQLLKVAAWILDTLHDAPGGKVVGFVMPSVRAKEIHELYSLKSRRIHFPHATWKYLVHTAANVARAFYNLHRNSHIMGDVNHGNCVVLRDGTVKLIDCDSYSIDRGDLRYRCDVGVGTHLAPELQGSDLGAIERIPSHDNFGLAVIIFQLLFLGRHPFAGTYLGKEEKSLEDCIKEHRFAFSQDAHLWKVKQPPGTLPLTAVTPRLSLMFERAFLTYDRPEPREWIEALRDLSESLKQCTLHIGHYYYGELTECPWCALESQTGLMLFPFVNSGAKGDASFDIFTIENLVSSLTIPKSLPISPTVPTLITPPTEVALKVKRARSVRANTFVVVQLFIVLLLTLFVGSGFATFVGACVMAGFLVALSNFDKDSRIDFEVKRETARREWEKLESEWYAPDAGDKFERDQVLIRQKIKEHLELQSQGREKIKLLRDGQFQYKLDVHLAKFKLSDAAIAGVAADVIAKLESNGLRTAADITTNRLEDFSEIDGETKTRLLVWRTRLEDGFDAAEAAELPESDRLRVTQELIRKRGAIEREIESLVGSLRAASTRVSHHRNSLAAKVEKIGRDYSQAEADLSAMGNVARQVVALIVVTVFFPTVSMVIANQSRGSRTLLRSSSAPSAPFAVKTATPDSKTLKVYRNPIPVGFSEADLDGLSEELKKTYAEQLLDCGAKVADEQADYARAEKDLKLALRMAPKHAYILQKLADVLYNSKKYKESNDMLERLLAMGPLKRDSRFLMGANYLKLRYFQEAQVIFSHLNSDDPSDFESAFNLGQAYKGLRQYHSAVASFEQATNLRPKDADAHYEYAFSLHKVGSRDDVVEQYQILLALRPKLAEKLKTELALKNLPNVPIQTYGEYGSGSGTGGPKISPPTLVRPVELPK